MTPDERKDQTIKVLMSALQMVSVHAFAALTPTQVQLVKSAMQIGREVSRAPADSQE